MGLAKRVRATNFNNVRSTITRHGRRSVCGCDVAADFRLKGLLPSGIELATPVCCSFGGRIVGPGCGPLSASVLLTSTLSTYAASRRGSSLLDLASAGAAGGGFDLDGIGFGVTAPGRPVPCSPAGFSFDCSRDRAGGAKRAAT